VALLVPVDREAMVDLQSPLRLGPVVPSEGKGRLLGRYLVVFGDAFALTRGGGVGLEKMNPFAFIKRAGKHENPERLTAARRDELRSQDADSWVVDAADVTSVTLQEHLSSAGTRQLVIVTDRGTKTIFYNRRRVRDAAMRAAFEPMLGRRFIDDAW
jgi:hypothetical protein